MLFLVRNHELINNREKTYLTDSASSSDTSLTVKAIDTNAWADNDWLIVGEIGTDNAEIMQVNDASLSDGTSLTIDNAGSGGLRFAHSVGEPVYRIDYNQIEFSHSSTDSPGSASTLATNEVQPDDEFTRYEDASNTSGFGFVRFKNSDSGAFSAYSDGIPYTGYASSSLGRMTRMVRRHLGNPSFKEISDEDIKEEINEKQRDVAHERLWPFYEDIFSDSREQYVREYDIYSKVVTGKVHTVTVESEPLAKVDSHRFDILFWDTSRTGESTHFNVWNNQIRVYPVPDSAASTTTLDGAITSSSSTITVDSTSGFPSAGRIIINDEVISYANKSSTQFRGIKRGVEGTTASSHSDADTVTDRDIIYTAHKEPDELLDPNDKTKIPDPLVLVYGAAMEIAAGKLQNESLHDRMKGKYDQALERLRDKFGSKGTSFNYRIKDKEEVVSDAGRFVDPNDFPEDISSA